jgi:hypothetical protein
MIDQFHRQLHQVVSEKLADRVQALINGDALTFEDYKKQIGYIEALNSVLTWAMQIESQMYGTKSPTD